MIIKNPWEILDYRVTKIKVIDPYDMDKILIQKGKDMVTLLTCHPYRGHGRYRYVVYCMRDHRQKIRRQKEIVKRTDGKAEYNNEECEKDPEKKRKIIVVLVVMASFVPFWYGIR